MPLKLSPGKFVTPSEFLTLDGASLIPDDLVTLGQGNLKIRVRLMRIKRFSIFETGFTLGIFSDIHNDSLIGNLSNLKHHMWLRGKILCLFFAMVYCFTNSVMVFTSSAESVKSGE